MAIALNPEHETYVVYIELVNSITLPSSSLLKLNIYTLCKPQIFGLIAEEAFIKIFDKYIDFADVFSLDLAFKLPKHTEISNHAIKLVNGWQSPYEPIYSLKPVELEILKTYIETNLANGFIRPSKSPAATPILFDQKSDSFFWWCIDYQSFNNLIINNRYLLSLIGELLDRLERVRRST